ncbi:ScbR family autoregulator-binding transcription factor [Streptomyces nanshensis]|uniref:HTH tetR-type domain-containing protein n=1 Tax=Streptomyces nanshensis TaxID=518642 RepID=A0A1E7KZ96_9ACTN|nr:ScbR family autoregulator-binding transcription factor [Streptomyces nanshensis]OEV09250.1 hypothetical protein AN218_22570 [Streptomyces nanshensis]
MTATKTKPLQRRAKVRRQEILNAAAQLFAVRGYKATTIEEICELSKSTQGALYYHFPSSPKFKLAKEVMMLQRDAVTLPDGPDGLHRLLAMNAYLARELQTNKILQAGVRLAIEQEEIGFTDVAPYMEWVGVFETQLKAAEAKGELRDGVDPHRAAMTIVGSFSGVQHLSKLCENRADLPERIQDLWNLMLRGIARPHVVLEMDPLTPTGDAAAG